MPTHDLIRLFITLGITVPLAGYWGYKAPNVLLAFVGGVGIGFLVSLVVHVLL